MVDEACATGIPGKDVVRKSKEREKYKKDVRKNAVLLFFVCFLGNVPIGCLVS